MPITEEERQLYYELIGVPNQTSVLNIDGEYGTGRKYIDYAITTAKTEIDARLDALTGAPLARLQVILARWKEISFSSTRLVPKESNEGVDVDNRRERALLIQRAQAVVGVFVARDRADGIPLG